MKRKRAEGAKTQSTRLVRASISFPPDLYESIEEIATLKKVSLAWVVRDAAEKYVVDETGEGVEGQTRSGAVTGKLTRGSR